MQACARYLVSSRFTSSEKMGLHVNSAGGLLAGVMANTRPDLFAAMILKVTVPITGYLRKTLTAIFSRKVFLVFSGGGGTGVGYSRGLDGLDRDSYSGPGMIVESVRFTSNPRDVVTVAPPALRTLWIGIEMRSRALRPHFG